MDSESGSRLFGFIGAGAMLGQLFCSLFAASMAWLGPVRTIYLRRFSEAIYLRRFSEVDDTHIWRFSTSGVYSTKSAYEALFIGATEFGSWERIWKSWVPGKCKFFMWTVAHNQCWTADRLAKRGLKHPPKCPLCDQVEKQLITCWSLVFLTGNFGSSSCSILGCKLLRHSWMITILLTGGRELAAGFLVRLVWKHRNYCVFDGGTPNLSWVVSTFMEDVQQWSIAGARGISYLLALAPTT